MSRTPRLDRSYEPADTAQPSIIFNEFLDWIEGGYLEATKTVIPTGITFTIPADHQLIVYGNYDVVGDLDCIGDLIIL